MTGIEFDTFYGWIALISTGVIILQFVLSFIVGEFDVDIDADGDVDFDMSSIVSPKGILHFLCGGSWYLVLKSPHLWYDYLIAIGVGLVLAFLITLVYWGMNKLAKHVEPECGEELVGRYGEVYLAQENSQYIIYTTINGASRELTVKSKGDNSYTQGQVVIIRSYEDGIYYID